MWNDWIQYLCASYTFWVSTVINLLVKNKDSIFFYSFNNQLSNKTNLLNVFYPLTPWFYPRLFGHNSNKHYLSLSLVEFSNAKQTVPKCCYNLLEFSKFCMSSRMSYYHMVEHFTSYPQKDLDIWLILTKVAQLWVRLCKSFCRTQEESTKREHLFSPVKEQRKQTPGFNVWRNE